MKKQFIIDLLAEYDQNKGIRRRLFGDETYVYYLHEICAHVLEQLSSDDEINGDHLRFIYQLALQRQEWIQLNSSAEKSLNYSVNYRLSNHIFHKLIFKMAQDHYDAKQDKLQDIAARELNEIDETTHLSPQPDGKNLLSDILAQPGQWFNTISSAYFNKCSSDLQAECKSSDLQEECKSSDPVELADITFDDGEYPGVIHDFRYIDLLGQENADRLDVELLENIDPSMLALTTSNHLIFSADVITITDDDGLLLNPEHHQPQSGPVPLDATEVRRIYMTRPDFFNEVRDSRRREDDEFLKDSNVTITVEMLDTIQAMGQRLRNDDGWTMDVTYETLAEFETYLDTIPERSKEYLLNRLPTVKRDICRHSLGKKIVKSISKIRRSGVAIGTNRITIEQQYDITTRVVQSQTSCNGLK